jgi:hypothetical protein
MIALVSSWVRMRVVECLKGSGSRRANDGNATRPTAAADEAVLVPVFGLALTPVYRLADSYLNKGNSNKNRSKN